MSSREPSPRPAKPDQAATRRAAQLHHEMSRAPVGSRERRFLRRAAARAKARAGRS